jgi:hypothetical protein
LVVAVEEIIAEEKNRKRRQHGDLDLLAHENGILAGALGAALLGAYRYEQLRHKGQPVVAAAAQA